MDGFSSLEELYKRVEPALNSKLKDLTRLGVFYVQKADIWNYLKKKNPDIQRIFYLYYNLDFTIKEISEELNLKESDVKNKLYRTLKELQKNLRKGL